MIEIDFSSHPLARELRTRLLSFGFTVLQGSRLETSLEIKMRDLLYEACLNWFTTKPRLVVRSINLIWKKRIEADNCFFLL